MNNRKNRFDSPHFSSGYQAGKRCALRGKDLPDFSECGNEYREDSQCGDEKNDKLPREIHNLKQGQKNRNSHHMKKVRAWREKLFAIEENDKPLSVNHLSTIDFSGRSTDYIDAYTVAYNKTMLEFVDEYQQRFNASYQSASQKNAIQENNRKRPRDRDIDQEENERKYLKDDNSNRVPVSSTPLDLPQPTLPQWQGSTHFASGNHSSPAFDKSPLLSPPTLELNDDWLLGEGLLFDK